jgi:hypothetical protein
MKKMKTEFGLTFKSHLSQKLGFGVFREGGGKSTMQFLLSEQLASTT